MSAGASPHASTSESAEIKSDASSEVQSNEHNFGTEPRDLQPTPSHSKIPEKRLLWKNRIILACAIVVTTYLMIRPTADQMRGTLPQNLGDPGLTTWILAWQTHALTTHPSQWFAGNMFYPYGNSLGYSELMLPLVPFFGAIYLMTDNPILAHNLVLLALVPFCLWTTFRLSRYLGCSPIGSFCAALAFTFNAYTFAHVGHLQLMTLGFFPLGFLCAFRMFDQRRIRDGVYLGLVTAALTTACLYYGVIWILILAVLIIADVVKSPKASRPFARFRPHLIASAVGGILLAPIGVLYIHFQASNGFKRPLSPDLGFDASDLLSPALGSRLYRTAGATEFLRSGSVEHTFFPGLVVIVLAGIGFIALRGRNQTLALGNSDFNDTVNSKHWRLFIGAGVVALILALGPTFGGYPAPFRFFYYHVPGFTSLRAVSRLAIAAMLPLAILAGRGLDVVASRSRLPGRAAAIGLCAIVLIELSAPVPRVNATRNRAEAALYQALKDLPAGPVIELPAGGSGGGIPSVFAESKRLLFSIGDWRQRFNGTSGGNPSDYLGTADILNKFPSEASTQKLHDLKIRFVVLHTATVIDDYSFTVDQAKTIVAISPKGSKVTWLEAGAIIELP